MRCRRAARMAGALVSVGVVSGCGSSAPPAAPAVVTQTVRETVVVTQAPPEPSPSAAPVVAPAEVPAAPATTAPPEVFKMPNLVGQNLQLAQDKLQVLGSYVMDQQDAAGLGRIQVIDSNWQVCTQSPAPGKKVPVETVVVLGAVKLAEQCP